MASKFEYSLSEICKQFTIDNLRPEQKEIINALVKKEDCIAIFPTGFGKSLPYQILVPFIRELKKIASKLEEDLQKQVKKHFDNQTIVVCCPLISLMQDQVERLSAIPNLRVVFKGTDPAVNEQIKTGEIDIVFASPETLVGESDWRAQFQTLKVDLIVVDEFHTIATWGGDENENERAVFRKWFPHIGELRSMFPSASLLALSATCTIKIRKRVANVLDLREESNIMITKSSNRSNIKLVISKTNNTIEEGMYWLISGMETLRHAFPKTLIYANSISDVAKLYTYVVNELPDCAEFVDMFHSETTEENKKTILNALRDNTSTKRVVFATSALGMGIDIGNCQSVVLYGPPHSVVDLVQEIGRVGRDGQSSVAIMLYNSYHLRNVDKDIKTLFKSETCRRQVLMGNFLEEPQLN
ncbi:ATP-dependent DNA helicase RecQ-like [Ostrea edulis]|uniref:ATP-dependent DNA helicase RecQ-like n=1 Tax=Ostrea edulis TaxID=37623 RepID=UPI0024AF1516|nr:ATP-dependent DNA helicase RecQ-like [Ostrea edulis]